MLGGGIPFKAKQVMLIDSPEVRNTCEADSILTTGRSKHLNARKIK